MGVVVRSVVVEVVVVVVVVVVVDVVVVVISQCPLSLFITGMDSGMACCVSSGTELKFSSYKNHLKLIFTV